MNQAETREKLLELAKHHQIKSEPRHRTTTGNGLWHEKQATLLRQVAETMKEGWVSVPEEPTEEMELSAQKLYQDEFNRVGFVTGMAITWADMYKAMLAARPK